MLVVKINGIHLKIVQRLFAALAHVFWLSRHSQATLLKQNAKFSAYKRLGSERGILEELPEKPLVLSLCYW
jgi:hypothetical protein